jgi:hypothetical protein
MTPEALARQHIDRKFGQAGRPSAAALKKPCNRKSKEAA